MNMLTTLERYHHPSKPKFIRQPNVGWKPRPQQEAKAPNTLDLFGMVCLEELPWCLPCQEPHPKEDYLRRMKEKYPRAMEKLIFIDISTLHDEECINVTEEQLEELRKREAIQT
jgi:hypothetical protein